MVKKDKINEDDIPSLSNLSDNRQIEEDVRHDRVIANYELKNISE